MTSLMLEEASAAPECAARHVAANADLYAHLAHQLRQSPPGRALTIARGSSDHAASYLAYLSAVRGGHLMSSLPMSLMTLYDAPIAARGVFAVAISQSGRSPDLIGPLTSLRAGHAQTLALVNDMASPLAEAATWAVPLHAGIERSVAATKSYICSLVGAAQLVANWCDDAPLGAALKALPDALTRATQQDWSAGVEALLKSDRIMVVSRGMGLAIAQEAALKLKETCSIQAEAFSGAEVKHGPMALVEKGYRMLILAPRGPAQAGLRALALEMRARGAHVLLAAPADVAERELTLATTTDSNLDPIAAIQSVYLMAEQLARARGYDPDTPRHLSKVTSTF